MELGVTVQFWHLKKIVVENRFKNCQPTHLSNISWPSHFLYILQHQNTCPSQLLENYCQWVHTQYNHHITEPLAWLCNLHCYNTMLGIIRENRVWLILKANSRRAHMLIVPMQRQLLKATLYHIKLLTIGATLAFCNQYLCYRTSFHSTLMKEQKWTLLFLFRTNKERNYFYTTFFFNI